MVFLSRLDRWAEQRIESNLTINLGVMKYKLNVTAINILVCVCGVYEMKISFSLRFIKTLARF